MSASVARAARNDAIPVPSKARIVELREAAVAADRVPRQQAAHDEHDGADHREPTAVAQRTPVHQSAAV